jgi:hypothetical protein
VIKVWSAGGDKSTRIRVCEEEWGFLRTIGFFGGGMDFCGRTSGEKIVFDDAS